MAFKPEPNQQLIISNIPYTIAEHPAARGMPYGQEGRAATVYQLKAQQESKALKVFKPRFRLPWLVGLTEQLTGFADLPGMQVCRRSVITALRQTELVRQHPDLNYAVLMPWIEGPTWMEVLLDAAEMEPQKSLELARSFANILARMEERRTAHCDLSGPNVLLPALAESSDGSYPSAIELVDVEQMYGPGLDRPEFVPGGSPGYAAHRAHRASPTGLWEPKADRFAGAVLLVEMLAWSDPAVREASWGESYFDPDEMQQETERYRVLVSSLREKWGSGVTDLFETVWKSETLSDCPTFGEWFVSLPADVPVAVSLPAAAAGSAAAPASAAHDTRVNELMERAGEQEQEGDLVGALETYRLAAAAAPAGGLQDELNLIATHLQTQIYGEASREGKPTEDPINALMKKAGEQEAQGDTAGALKSYRQALSLAPADSGLQQELILITHQLQSAIASTAVAQPVVTGPAQTETVEQAQSTGPLPEPTQTLAQAEPAEIPVDHATMPEPPVTAPITASQLDTQAAAPAAQVELPVEAKPEPEPVTRTHTAPQITTVVGAVPIQASTQPPATTTVPATAGASTTSATSTTSTVSTASSEAPTVAVPVSQSRTNVNVATTRKGGMAKWVIPAVLGAVLLLFGGIALTLFMNRSNSPVVTVATATVQAAATSTIPVIAGLGGSPTTSASDVRSTQVARTALALSTAGAKQTVDTNASHAATASAATAQVIAQIEATRKAAPATVQPTVPVVVPPTSPPAQPTPQPKPTSPPAQPTPVPPTANREATTAALAQQATARSIDATARAIEQVGKNQQATIEAQNAAATRVAQQATAASRNATVAAQQATIDAKNAADRAAQQATAAAQQATTVARQNATKTAQAIQQATAEAERQIAAATAAAVAATQTKLAQPLPTNTAVPNFCPGVPNRVNMLIGKGTGKLLGNCGAAGTEFVFIGQNFRAGETVTVTVTDPNGAAYGSPVQLNTDSSGSTDTFDFKTTPSSTLGIWTITMTGNTTGKRALGYIKLFAP